MMTVSSHVPSTTSLCDIMPETSSVVEAEMCILSACPADGILHFSSVYAELSQAADLATGE